MHVFQDATRMFRSRGKVRVSRCAQSAQTVCVKIFSTRNRAPIILIPPRWSKWSRSRNVWSRLKSSRAQFGEIVRKSETEERSRLTESIGSTGAVGRTRSRKFQASEETRSRSRIRDFEKKEGNLSARTCLAAASWNSSVSYFFFFFSFCLIVCVSL